MGRRRKKEEAKLACEAMDCRLFVVSRGSAGFAQQFWRMHPAIWQSDGHDRPRLVDELVPAVAAVIDGGVGRGYRKRSPKLSIAYIFVLRS
jgi:hypothetical protein